MTAYVTPLPRSRTKRDGEMQMLDAEAQLRWEIGMRKLGTNIADVSILSGIARGRRVFPPQEFSLRARVLHSNGRAAAAPEYWSPPADAELVAAQVLFNQPVWGPLAFGFGAHFGLGLFEPADAEILADDL